MDEWHVDKIKHPTPYKASIKDNKRIGGGLGLAKWVPSLMHNLSYKLERKGSAISNLDLQSNLESRHR